jgi:hypothetical protein
MFQYILTLALCCLVTGQSFALQPYSLITKNGLQGVANAQGEELIPPRYESIGWSDGSFHVFGELVGYREDGKWGLLNLKDKKVTKPEYIVLKVLDSTYLLAGLKGRFTNHVFYGLLNQRGRQETSFQYVSIEPFAGHYQVEVFEATRLNTGILHSDGFEVLVPVQYASLEILNDQLWKASDHYDRQQLYLNNGRALLDYTIEDITAHPLGFVIRKDGFEGLISENGQLLVGPQYKEIGGVVQPIKIPFQRWELKTFKLDSATGFWADSIIYANDLYITYRNGNQNVIQAGNKIFGDRMVKLKEARSGYFIVEERGTGKWHLVRNTGQRVIENQDSIYFDDRYFYTLQKDGWQLYNRFGRKLSYKSFQKIKPSIANMVPARRNDHWGLLDFQGENVIPFKFDELGQGTDGLISVRFLDSWGVVDYFGNWIISPEYSDIHLTTHWIIAVKGDQQEVFDRAGGKIATLRYQWKDQEHYLELSTVDQQYGVMAPSGEVIFDPIFQEVGHMAGMYYGKLGDVILLRDSLGREILTANDQVQELLDYGASYFLIKKSNSYGFVDRDGKLRIANRYENAKVFSEGLAPIMIQGKWGFIDKQELIRIQPVYEDATIFRNGLSIIQKGGMYGLLATNGELVIKPQFRSIEYYPGKGYILIDDQGEMGAANEKGTIIIRPNYDRVAFTGNDLLLVQRNGLSGIFGQFTIGS